MRKLNPQTSMLLAQSGGLGSNEGDLFQNLEYVFASQEYTPNQRYVWGTCSRWSMLEAVTVSRGWSDKVFLRSVFRISPNPSHTITSTTL